MLQLDDTANAELSEEQEAMLSEAVLETDEALTNEEVAPGSDLTDAGDAGVLQGLIDRANALRGPSHDPKLQLLIKEVKRLLADGYRPVVFCRFRPTAHYVAAELQEALPKRSCAVAAVTGELPPMSGCCALANWSRKPKPA